MPSPRRCTIRFLSCPNLTHTALWQPVAAQQLSHELTLKKAADFLRQESEILDTLPSHRQLHRFWTSARVLNETGASEEAFSAYKAAILCGDDSNSDPRDFFLLFEEARAVVGADSVRLGPLVVVLKEKLPQLCEMPEAFLFAKGYLDDLSAQAYERLPYRIEGLKQTESKAGDGEWLHPL